MNHNPLFSICIPCFNHGSYIGQTLESVLRQDFDDYEIVVADNASTDNSREVVRSFQDPRIRLIENRFNIGFAPNLQQVTRHAQGRYLNVLSSDDVMNPGALRTYADLIARYGGSPRGLVLMCQAWEINGEGKVVGYITKNLAGFGPVRLRVPDREQIEAQEHHEVHAGFQVFVRCMKRLETAGMFCTVTYSKELWEAVEGYNSTQLINPDKHFIVKVLRHDPLVIYVNRPLYSYRSHAMGQARQIARERSLKFHVDEYAYLLQYDEEWLRGTGVTRAEQRRLFVSRDCLNQALVGVAEGRWFWASRLLAFAWSTYPDVVLRQPKSWALAVLLLGGPVGIAASWLLRWAFNLYRRRVFALEPRNHAPWGEGVAPVSEPSGS